MIGDEVQFRRSSEHSSSPSKNERQRFSRTIDHFSPVKTSPPKNHTSPARADPAEILKSILLPEYLEKAIVWLKKSDEREIQGLRVVGQVIKHRGEKKFRKRADNAQEGLFDLSTMTFKKANAEFLRMNYQSAYGKFFGRLPALMDLGDVQILRYKKFSEVPCTVILNSYAKAYLDSWQTLKDDPYYES